MNWVRISTNLDKDKVKQLDGFIQYPVSRSQVINAILEYVLRSPEFLQSIINNEQEKINAKIENSI